MSGRPIAGIGSRSGRRERSVRWDDRMMSQEDREAFRKGLADFERDHGGKGRVYNAGLPRNKTRRARPMEWRARFLVALRRDGRLKEAAQKARVAFGTVRNDISTDLSFRSECLRVIGERTWRQIQRASRRSGRDIKISQRTAQALVAYLEGRGQ